MVICLVNRLHENSFQERGSCFKGRRRYWNISRTLNSSLPNDDHTLLTLILLEMARETRKWKMETKIRNSLPIPCVVPFFFFFLLPVLAFRSPDPRSPFLVISEIILLNNTMCIEKAERWNVWKLPGEYNSRGNARRKSLQTSLNVKGSRITHILGAAEPPTPRRYKNAPWRSSESSNGDLLRPTRPKRYESPKWCGEQPLHFCKSVSPGVN